AFGKPRILVVPNGFHRQDAPIYKKRYPDLKVVCPAGARKRVEKVIATDSALEEAGGDDTVSLLNIDGMKNSEGVLSIRSGDKVSLAFADFLLNMPESAGLIGFFLSPTGRPSVPRVVRWLGIKNKKAVASHLERLAETPGLTRVLVGHGQTISTAPAEALKSAAKELLG
ncbi:MAG TPA: hypothetical protein VGP93_07345, partial [Polyangiaceae bacterium]|nr:hypothetical protein [Polyangiaceae bacterium]